MKNKATRHTIGIEEEYLLVDLESRALVPKRNARSLLPVGRHWASR